MKKHLELVDKVIAEKLTSDAPVLAEASSYLLSLGGKRLRPKLCLLVNSLLNKGDVNPQIYELAAGIELIHMATLLHDDIIDKSNLRRHKLSPRAKYGEECTLLAGDFMLVRSFGICSKYSAAIIRETEKACVELTEGEILEIMEPIENESLEASANIAIKKTASLFRLASFCGASLSQEKSEFELNAWSNFGENYGLAYQMFDDIADAFLDEKDLGKPSGLDIIERKPSLINILWLQSGSNLAKKVLLDKTPLNQDDLQACLKEIRGGDIGMKAYGKAKFVFNLGVDELRAFYGQSWSEYSETNTWQEICSAYENLDNLIQKIIS